MGGRIAALTQLQRLAQLKSDLEMRRFSAFRAHVGAAQARIATLEDDLQQIYQSDSAFSIEQARMANALAGETSRALGRAERDLQQLMPRFEQARRDAMREFGRVQALRSLRDCETQERRKNRHDAQ